MTKVKFEKIFNNICIKHGITVYYNDPNIKKNDGYAKWNEVHLGTKYSNNSIFIAVALHEFSHAIINLKRNKNIKKYSVCSNWNEEFMAWALAMRYYTKYFKKTFNKKQSLFLLKCLKTHAVTDYAFKDTFHDKF